MFVVAMGLTGVQKQVYYSATEDDEGNITDGMFEARIEAVINVH